MQHAVRKTDSPACTREGVRIALETIASCKWDLKSLDVSTAFLQGKIMEREVHFQPPKEANTDNLWLLRKCVYGLMDASRYWYLRVREELTRLNGVVSQLDQGIFLFYHSTQLCGIITCFVDDMIYGGDADFEKNIITQLKTIFSIGTENHKTFSYVGIKVNQNDDKSITIDQQNYAESLQQLQLSGNRSPDDPLNEYEKKQFRGLVGQLNWLSGISCPELSFEVCLASTKTKSPCVRDVARLKSVKQLKSTSTKLHFPCLNPDNVSLMVYSDASFNNLPKGGSQGAHIVFLKDDTNRCCPIAWSSSKVKRVVRSTLAAETLALADGYSTGEYLQKLLGNIFPSVNKKKITAITDNKSLYDNLQTSHRVSDKSLIIDISYLRERIDREELHLEWKDGSKQLSNVLTKKGASPEQLRTTLSYGSFPEC